MTAFGIDFGTTNSVVAAFSTSGLEVLAVDEPPAAVTAAVAAAVEVALPLARDPWAWRAAARNGAGRR